jgi:hypothetical protein
MGASVPKTGTTRQGRSSHPFRPPPPAGESFESLVFCQLPAASCQLLPAPRLPLAVSPPLRCTPAPVPLCTPAAALPKVLQARRTAEPPYCRTISVLTSCQPPAAPISQSPSPPISLSASSARFSGPRSQALVLDGWGPGLAGRRFSDEDRLFVFRGGGRRFARQAASLGRVRSA